MGTAQRLSALAVALGGDPRIEEGDLSLALAAAELIDLTEAQAVLLHGDRLLPAAPVGTGSPMLIEAASELVRDAPYETVVDWLWRRGSGLAGRYRAAVAEARHVHRDAAEAVRDWNDPVLAHLAAAAGMRPTPPDDTSADLDHEQIAILGEVHQAVTQLAAERQRRSIERGPFEGILRGF
ncbi:GPP34 family phosphoprotein [Streptomyces sp. WAC 04229]|uniref:GPP34 family phosphoprotein n=1 Tax=Streptomyces sp. WAC 04229 TaxID=2203206 RepID=UPI000F73FEEE|nr:GPP34 family phosphoprotein [Streptomyces sp. WAC 04229]RSN45370.1 GPP34 family phosphoprotein [Streptomyces sp. WAC 04229]